MLSQIHSASRSSCGISILSQWYQLKSNYSSRFSWTIISFTWIWSLILLFKMNYFILSKMFNFVMPFLYHKTSYLVCSGCLNIFSARLWFSWRRHLCLSPSLSPCLQQSKHSTCVCWTTLFLVLNAFHLDVLVLHGLNLFSFPV